MKLHKSITATRVTDAIWQTSYTLANPGFCAHCGEDADGCEPDAREYLCESCGKNAVYGAQEILFLLTES